MDILTTFDYTNHRGETSRRRVLLGSLIRCVAIPPWYPEPTQTIRGYDVDKREYRDFQLSKMLNIQEERY